MHDNRPAPRAAGRRRRLAPRSPGWRGTLHRFAHSPSTKLVTGGFLLLTAVAELVEGMFLDLDEVLDPSHALVVLGGVLVIQSLAEILEAAEHFDEAEEAEAGE